MKTVPKSITTNEKYIEQVYHVTSTTIISLPLNDQLSKVYDDQLKFGINLSVDINPERSQCSNENLAVLLKEYQFKLKSTTKVVIRSSFKLTIYIGVDVL